MLWIKRNLFLAIGGLTALILLGGGAFFLYTRLSKSKALEAEIEDKLAALTRANIANPSWSKTNIALAKADLASVTGAINRAANYFVPVAHERLSGLAFKTLLDNTIAELRKEAGQASVRLPSEDYAFSFGWEKGVLTLPEDCFPALPAQLAEVAQVSRILFAARINALESISRPRISVLAPTSDDYHSLPMQTNQVAKMVLTPYRLTFLCFSAELAAILEGLYQGQHCFLVKSLEVEAIVPEPGPFRPLVGPRGEAPAEGRAPPRGPRPPPPPRDELETVINERPLKVSLLLKVIKPAEVGRPAGAIQPGE